MTKIYNGISADKLPGDLKWRKSLKSGNYNCVELAALPDGEFAVRNSRFPDGPALIYTAAEIHALVEGTKDGEFDDLLS